MRIAQTSHVKQGWTAEMTLDRMLLIRTLLTGLLLNEYFLSDL